MNVTSAPKPLKLVTLGDSLTAGTQDGFTYQPRQEHGWAPDLAHAAGLPWHPAYIDKQGIPLDVFVHGSLDMGHVEQRQKVLQRWLAPLSIYTFYVGTPLVLPPVWHWAGQGERDKRTLETPQDAQTNFAVPGFRANDLVSIATARDMARNIHNGSREISSMAQEVPLTRAILQNGGHGHVSGTAVDRAVQSNPDLVTVWAGSNDALHAMYAGYIDDRLLTPVHDQPWTFRETSPVSGKVYERTTKQAQPGFETSWLGPHGIMQRLLKETSAEIFLFTIPQVTVVPALRELGKKVGPLPYRVILRDGTDVTEKLENWTVPSSVQGAGKNGRKEFPPGTSAPVTTILGAFLRSGELTGEADLNQAMQVSSDQGFLGEDEVMDPDELAQVAHRVDDFNDVLHRAAALDPRVHVVDMNAILEETQKSGRHLRGAGPQDVVVTNTFTGVQDARGMEGMFSFDGLHPSDTGYAVIANAALDQMKRDTAANPRFAALQAAAEVDEKAAFLADPHRGKQMSLVLDRPHVQALHTAGV